MSDLGALQAVLARTKRRMRFGRAWASLGVAAIVGASLAALHAALTRLFGSSVPWTLEVALFAGALILSLLVALVLPVRDQGAAARLDAAHDLHDRVRSAVEFARTSPRTPFMDAAVRDAIARASQLDPRRAVRFTTPTKLSWAALPLAAWLAVGLWPAAAPKDVRASIPARAKVIEDDELAAFREELKALEEAPTLTAEASADVRAYNALLERIATGELDRSEALEALIALERKLMNQGGPSEVDAAVLRELARDLARADEALAKALEAQDANAASDALKKLAQRYEQSELSKAQREELARALDAARKREQRLADDQARASELERLLKDKEKDERALDDPGERSLFEKKKRELERLRRDIENQTKRHRELSRLSRDLSDASSAMAEREDEGAAESMRRGAEDLSRYGQDQMTQEQREQLARQIQQLRESMQRNGQQQKPRFGDQQQDESDRASRTQRFVLRAQGKDPDEEAKKLVMRMPGKGSQGQGQGQDGEQGESGQQNRGQGAQGQGQEGGEGQDGKPQQGGGQQGDDQVLVLGGDQPPNAEIELPGMGGTQTIQTDGAGKEHDPRMLRSPTDLDAAHEDSRLAGTPGKGPTRSQVILDAADRGFATASYRKVYTDYRAHAEDVLEGEDVPPGYRFYVRRYFQLIRPRDQRETP